MNNGQFFEVPGSGRRYDRNWMLAVLLISLMLSLLQVSSVNNLLPSIERSMDAGESAIQLVLSGYALAVGIILVPAGRLGDIWGRSSMWVAGLVVFTGASLACGLADSSIHLNMARVIQGIGAGLYSPQVTGLIQQYFQGRARARAFGLMGLVVSMSVAVGPLISGGLVAVWGEDPGWRYSFFLNVPLGLLGILGAWRFLPFLHEREAVHSDDGNGSRRSWWRRFTDVDLDPCGMFLLAAAVTGIMVPFMLHGVSWRWFLFAAGVLMVGVWILWERWYDLRGHHPMVSLAMFRISSFSYCTGISALQFLGSSTIFVTIALFLQDGLGESALLVGVLGLPYALISGAAAVWSGRHALEKGKSIQVLALGLMILAVLATLVTARGVSLSDWHVYWLAVPLIPLGVGAGCMGAANQTQAMLDVPPAHGGTAGGLQQTTQRITTAIGNSLITGVLFSTYRGGTTVAGWSIGLTWSLLVIAGFLVCAWVLAWTFWYRTSPHAAQ